MLAHHHFHCRLRIRHIASLWNICWYTHSDYIGRYRLPRKVLRAWYCSVGSVEVIVSGWGIFPNTYGLSFDCREWLFLQVEVMKSWGPDDGPLMDRNMSSCQ